MKLEADLCVGNQLCFGATLHKPLKRCLCGSPLTFFGPPSLLFERAENGRLFSSSTISVVFSGSSSQARRPFPLPTSIGTAFIRDGNSCWKTLQEA